MTFQICYREFRRKNLFDELMGIGVGQNGEPASERRERLGLKRSGSHYLP